MLFTCILCFSLIYIFYKYGATSYNKQLPPGPSKLPILGNLLQLSRMKKKFGFSHLVWKELLKEYGPIVYVKMGSTDAVFVSDLSLIKEIGSNDALQGRPDGFFYRKRALGGRGGLVFSEGPIWAEQRRFCLSHIRFTGSRQEAMQKLINQESESMVEWLEEFNGHKMTYNSSISRFILNVIWSFTAGDRYHRNDPKLLRVCEMIDKSFRRMTTTGSILNQLPFLRFIVPNLSGYTEYCELQNEIMNFIQDSINEHKSIYPSKKEEDLIYAILSEMKKDNQTLKFTDRDLYVICLDLLYAGTDTTSNSMSFVIAYLMNHQDIQEKVHTEIDQVLGPEGTPSLRDKQRMPYLQAVIQEVQRIANVPPGGIPHRATQNTYLGGYFIPKDTVLVTVLSDLHHNETWQDPHTFNPERFMNAKGELIKLESFIPFGYGKRKCVGEVLAKSVLFLFCCRIFQKFHVYPPTNSSNKFEIVDGITLSVAPFDVVWKKR